MFTSHFDKETKAVESCIENGGEQDFEETEKFHQAKRDLEEK